MYIPYIYKWFKKKYKKIKQKHNVMSNLNKINRYQRQQKQQEEGLLPNAETLTLSPSRIKCHHPKCPRVNLNQSGNIPYP